MNRWQRVMRLLRGPPPEHELPPPAPMVFVCEGCGVELRVCASVDGALQYWCGDPCRPPPWPA